MTMPFLLEGWLGSRRAYALLPPTNSVDTRTGVSTYSPTKPAHTHTHTDTDTDTHTHTDDARACPVVWCSFSRGRALTGACRIPRRARPATASPQLRSQPRPRLRRTRRKPPLAPLKQPKHPQTPPRIPRQIPRQIRRPHPRLHCPRPPPSLHLGPRSHGPP